MDNSAQIKEYLAYVEKAKSQGIIYYHGISKLHELNIKNHPELLKKLNQIINNT